MVRKNRLILVLFLLSFTSHILGQVSQDKYIVYFTDKDNNPYSIDEPEEFLSQRSIQRRENQGILITKQDLPVNPSYIADIEALGELDVLFPIKWFNAILIETTDPDVLDAIEDMNIVGGLELSSHLDGASEIEEELRRPFISKTGDDYGPSLNQINMLGGLGLHEDGFNGEGVWIGVFDGGFTSANTIPSLSEVIDTERLLATWNFVDGNDDVYGGSTHGTRVLSTMASYQPDSLIGTGYGASYALFITEDVSEERRIEEANWARAAEVADSLGIDIINTSLGYTLFDEDDESYSYEDMDGGTTLITRASDIAASKGMLIVTSAGNSGNSDWFYISAPADGDSVLAVGAVEPDSEIASFSSRGPSADGRVKPNVCAQGAPAVFTDLSNGITSGNGTSFASPILAGMAASLWQEFPQATAWQIHQAIEESSHLFENPNDSLGYGIPNFEFARTILGSVLSVEEVESRTEVLIYPNPISSEELKVFLPVDLTYPLNIKLMNMQGRIILEERIRLESEKGLVEIGLNSSNLPAGFTYFF